MTTPKLPHGPVVPPPSAPAVDPYEGVPLKLSQSEAAALCGAIAYTLGENVAPDGDPDVLRGVSARIKLGMQSRIQGAFS